MVLIWRDHSPFSAWCTPATVQTKTLWDSLISFVWFYGQVSCQVYSIFFVFSDTLQMLIATEQGWWHLLLLVSISRWVISQACLFLWTIFHQIQPYSDEHQSIPHFTAFDLLVDKRALPFLLWTLSPNETMSLFLSHFLKSLSCSQYIILMVLSFAFLHQFPGLQGGWVSTMSVSVIVHHGGTGMRERIGRS